MLDLTVIFKMAGCGMVLLVLDNVLKSCGKNDVAAMVDIAGITILLLMVMYKVNEVFTAIKTMFTI